MTITELLYRFEILVENSRADRIVLIAPIMPTSARSWVAALNDTSRMEIVPGDKEGHVTSQDLSDLLKYVSKLQNESKR